MISLKDYFMGRDTSFASQLTPEIRANATDLLARVNSLLLELGIGNASTSSGWRPPSINSVTPGAATHSLHQTGKAIDIADVGHKIYDAIMKRPDLLDKFGLWVEDKDSTPTWTHIDSGTRTPRLIRKFKP